MASLRASPTKLEKIKAAREVRGYQNWRWPEEAEKVLGRRVSKRTWQRFLAGDSISANTFKAFCTVLDLDWQDIADVDLNSPSLQASAKGLQKIKEARQNIGWSIDDDRWLKEASKVVDPNWQDKTRYYAPGVSLASWKDFVLYGRPVKEKIFRAYCQVLELNVEQIVLDEIPELDEFDLFPVRPEQVSELHSLKEGWFTRQDLLPLNLLKSWHKKNPIP